MSRKIWTSCGVLGVVLAMAAAATPVHAQDGFLTIPNPGFEENAAADGLPDGWKIAKGAEVSLSTYASEGAKAAKFTDGYVLLEIDQKLQHLAGRKMTLTFDAAGEGEAELGVMLGYVRKMPDGQSKFGHSQLTWGRKLTKQYAPVAVPLNFSDTAVDGRVWVGVYRSNKKGIVYLDNFACSEQSLSKDQQTAMVRLQREWDYLLTRAQDARPHLADKGEIDRVIQQVTSVRDRCLRLDAKLLAETAALERQWTNLGARIYQLQAPGQLFVAGLSAGSSRLDPAEPLADPAQDPGPVLMLTNEYQALGVILSNCQEQPSTFQVDVLGLDKAGESLVVRQQIFQENYYDKQKVRQTDALTKLARNGSAWAVDVPGGRSIKLYVGFKSTAAMAQTNPVRIRIRSAQGREQTLNATVSVLPIDLPHQPLLEHKQFMYPGMAPAGANPEQAAQDLADHEVNAIEFPFAPPAVFNPDGSIKEVKFANSPQDRWMRAYGPRIRHLVLFWEGSMLQGLPMADGGKLPALTAEQLWTPQTERAYGQLLRAWLDYAAQNGFGLEHWAVMPGDEVASHEQWASAPGPRVQRMMQLCRVTRQVESKLPIYATLGIYSLPEDVKSIGSWLDVAIAYYPYPTTLARWSPPNFNPNTVFATLTYPYLESLRQSRGTRITSYHVSRGKKDPVLAEVMAYPVMAVANGFTGIGFWAYNVTGGRLTWDDTDGGILDYSFIYDGQEDHPLNRQYNVTGEIIVPSIRWEALRLGWQDGQVLLALKSLRDKGALGDDQNRQIDDLLATARNYGQQGESLTESSYVDYARKLRQLYASISQTDHSAMGSTQGAKP